MLTLSLQTPAQAVAADAALRRLKPSADQLAAFTKQLGKLLKHLDPTKIERHGETHILDFLRDTTPALGPGAGTERYGNVNGKRDLALHLGDTAQSPVGVIIEVKGPQNSNEMLSPDDLNRKAFQQLLLYYLEDRSDDRADDFRRLVVTTGFEWYIFDAQDFNSLFWKDAGLRRDFKDWKAKAKASADTDFFYKSIAGKYLAAATGTLRATYVDLRGGLPSGATELGHLWRVFGPAYLLKDFPDLRPDANTLNQEFYAELLYLMGLQERTEGGVRRIGRCAPADRQPGALLENILYQMDIGHDLSRAPAEVLAEYGDDPTRQREEVALALCLMWVNRLLFLKLLEGQLLRYHPAEAQAGFRFLHAGRVPEYDELNKLFFGVLNRPPASRPADVAAAFRELPYLNSSLFQPAVLEETVLYIRELNDRAGLRPFAGSVLKKKGATVPQAAPDSPGEWLALPYLLGFLDAFDFGSEPTGAPHPPAPSPSGEGEPDGANAQKSSGSPGKSSALSKKSSGSPSPEGEGAGGWGAPPERPLLSAAVLGLVFEKINGYRDGSFYTPGFVTMYMARHSLRRAVVRRFTQGAGASRFPELRGCDTWEELRDSFDKKRRREYADWFNGLTVLDPAVGSGHFLVSALNELLACKADLRLLLDADGQLLNYTLTVEHDELRVLDNDTDLPARYQVATYDAATGHRTVAQQHTRLQAALFREKRALMEHSLFGVDLNPNSVRICRLRLWIELLKHAYYRPDTDFRALETLPNLDLNVRTGNSLVSRHALQAPLGPVFRAAGITVERYKSLVHDYFGASGQQVRTQLDGVLADIKANVGRRISQADPHVKKLADAELQVLQLEKSQSDLFGKKLDPESYAVELRKRTLLVEQRRQELADHRQGTFFQQAFEWRFEFPEVLDNDARFLGFDVVLGNPPYIRQEAFAASKPFFKQRFKTFDSTADLYVYFVELGLDLLAPGGELSFIAPNKWLSTGYGKGLRKWLKQEHELIEFIDFGDLYVFPQTKAYPAILSVRRTAPSSTSSFRAAAIPKLPPPSLESMVLNLQRTVAQDSLREEGWSLADSPKQELLAKLRAAGKPFGEYIKGKIYSGIKTGNNAAFVINAETRARLIAEDAKSAEMIEPFLAGRDVKRYKHVRAENYLIKFPRGWTWEKLGWQQDSKGRYTIPPAEKQFSDGYEALMWHYPALAAYMLDFLEDPLARTVPGNFWWELRACDYYDKFEEPKIMWKEIAIYQEFTLDREGNYSNNKTFFTPSNDLYLLGVLNSKPAFFFLQQITTKMKDNAMAMQVPQVSQLPIPTATPAQQAAVATLVEQILAARAAAPAADTAALEAQVDALVADLYGLSAAEAALVAGGAGAAPGTGSLAPDA
ncbi:Eco57I restriction-modification methylase domain-containing protein [Hymenobacter sp. ASUV-10]|uniref:site-specific DNA-methyltransferase (adenine-specific) n=1 Tax=Hymenobacter aranciens TaxID=3063996 RepID=A0ABT9BBN8_9BACT|nr:Eco57I restriction-modification methylase domain-containing protein [Hymenobacter sp. ASUV-10]MDO7875685.1 Eco57I restriction-modification methylase domain-containing protein [Hymenobacter sp. ASUV-10]